MLCTGSTTLPLNRVKGETKHAIHKRVHFGNLYNKREMCFQLNAILHERETF